MNYSDQNINDVSPVVENSFAASCEVVERLKSMFERLNASNCYSNLIDEVYRSDMLFEDSFHSIEGIDSFKAYCSSLYQNLRFCDFVFHQQWVGVDDAMLTWTMSYSHARLKGGRVIQVDGATHIKFDDKVYFHKDYFDGGALLYEQVPLLGSVIKQIKKRMV